MALIVWPTTAANSYVSQADATIYLSLRLNSSEWTAADSATKDAALATMFRLLNEQDWSGEKTDPSQVLPFPRTGLKDREGHAIADDIIPPDLISAQIEGALLLLQDPSLIIAGDTDKNISSLRAGPAAISYFKPQAGTGRFPSSIVALIGYLLAGGSAAVGGGMIGCPTGTHDLDRETRHRSYPRGPL